MITKDSPLSAHRLVWRWVLSGDLAVGIAVALVGLCLVLLETMYSKRLAVPRCGYGDITAGHSQGMITKDSPFVCASPRLEVGIISKFGCGNSNKFVWVVPSTTGDDMFQGASGPKVWIRRYCCWSFSSRHDQRETLRLRAHGARREARLGARDDEDEPSPSALCFRVPARRGGPPRFSLHSTCASNKLVSLHPFRWLRCARNSLSLRSRPSQGGEAGRARRRR